MQHKNQSVDIDSLIKELVAAGKLDPYERLPAIIDKFTSEGIYELIKKSFGFWGTIADSLPEDDLVAMIKSLAILEGQYRISMISGTPIPVLLKRLMRLPGLSTNWKALANWVNENSDNQYSPYGTVKYGYRSSSQKLYIAVRRKDYNAICALMNNGADPNLMNAEGKSALDIARASGDEAAVHALTTAIAPSSIPKKGHFNTE
jgi:hypothetical protein